MAFKSLYHGTTSDFNCIDITKGKGYKDFGPGFYCSFTKSQAIGMAKRNKWIQIELAKTIKNKPITDINAYVYEYNLDLGMLAHFNCKHFGKADIEWINFVFLNRCNRYKVHNFDVVIGSTADDDTKTTFNDYKRGSFGPPNSPKALEMLISLLKPDKLPFQFCVSNHYLAHLMDANFIKRELLQCLTKIE